MNQKLDPFKGEKEYYHKNGIISAKLPYIASTNSLDYNETVRVNYCDVEIHIGHPGDIKAGRIATVIVSKRQDDTMGVNNFITTIADQVKVGFLDSRLQPIDKSAAVTRFIVRNHFPVENFQEVHLDWHPNHLFSLKEWGDAPAEDDWIYKENRLAPYQ